MVGGLDKQIQEIKEVIELPIKHPELFEALGVAQPKVWEQFDSFIIIFLTSSSFLCIKTRESYYMDHRELVTAIHIKDFLDFCF
jgi:hypothetical protein